MTKLEENSLSPESVQLYNFRAEDIKEQTQNETDYDAHTAPTRREQWGSGLEFVFSVLGVSVGLGNLWRFPYLCMRNGGGAFLIPFLFVLVTCGLPLFFLEVSLGQFRGKGIVHVWDICPVFRGIGIGMLIAVIVVCVYYNIIIAWILYYMGNSLQSELPWTRCDGWWTTDACFRQDQARDFYKNMSMTPQYNNSTPLSLSKYKNDVSTRTAITYNSFQNRPQLQQMISTEQFWEYNVLQISGGIEDIGFPSWYMALSLAGAWFIIFLCIFKGVKSIGKVVYVTALLPYLLLLVILIRGVTLPGAVDGIILFLKPDVQKLMTLQVWVEAALQVFYSLGPGWGALISMASFCRFNENALRTSILVTFVGEATSIFSGFVVFTILGFMAHELHVPVEDVVKSGPGLGFVAYPQALTRLPLPQFWCFLFFLMLLSVGLDSQFALVELVVSTISDIFPKLRRRKIVFSAIVCAVLCVLGLVFVCPGGIYVMQLVDWYLTSIALPLFCILECLIVGWIYGVERFSNDISLMLGRGVPIVIRFCWTFLTPFTLLVCLLFTIATYKPPTYGDYQYPSCGYAIGWIISMLPVVPVIIMPIYQLYVHTGATLKEKLLSSIEPSPHWRPHTEDCDMCYDDVKFSYKGYGIKQRIKLNITGRC